MNSVGSPEIVVRCDRAEVEVFDEVASASGVDLGGGEEEADELIPELKERELVHDRSDLRCVVHCELRDEVQCAHVDPRSYLKPLDVSKELNEVGDDGGSSFFFQFRLFVEEVDH